VNVWGSLKARLSGKTGPRRASSPKRLGLFPSSGFGALFRHLLEKKGVRTFRDLRRPDLPGRPPRYRVQMVGADVSRGRLVLLPDDIVHYSGFDSPDDLDVALAMRISMSVPAFFRPVALTEKGSGKTCYLVDGGVLSQFPIAYFNLHGRDERPTIGIRIKRPEDIDQTVRIHGPVSLLMACALTAIEGHDARLAESDDWRSRTVLIHGRDVANLNFLLSNEQKSHLFEEGVAAARAFLANPASRSYLRRFRGGAA
ncbi:patatin-like phospholipase family protein, partial [Singulisphaera rosea]